MKLIFLDIDGVLNSDLWFKGVSNKQKRTPTNNLDPKAIRHLNKIISRTGAKVVLSSNWRLKYTYQEVQGYMKACGFEGEIIDQTPDMMRENPDFVRGNEILKWCREHEDLLECRYQKYRDFVILDDKDDMLYWQRKNLFRTDRYCGLTPNLAYEAITFLASLKTP